MTSNESESKETSLFAKPLILWTRGCLAFPVQTLLFITFLLFLSLWLTLGHLHFKTSRLDLINPKSDFNRLWIDYIEEFGDRDDLVIVVEGKNADTVKPVLDELSVEIEKYPELFDSVLGSIDTTAFMKKGLHFVETPMELQQIRGFIEQNVPLLQGEWGNLSADRYLATLGYQLSAIHGPTGLPQQVPVKIKEELLRQISTCLDSLQDTVSPEPTGKPGPMPVISQLGTLQREYFIADEGRLGVVLLKITESKEGSFTYGTQSIEQLRKIIQEIRGKHPETQIGLTGLTVMENDEMRTSQIASTQASILSFIGVTVIFIATFGGLRFPLIAVSALAVGLGLTMGFIVLSVGHLNILSMSFGVILIGLGIDFGIHYISRYMEMRRAGYETDDAILRTVEALGPGIFVGAMTTAFAFLAIGLSEFTGIAELGIVSAGGVIICCITAITIIPIAIHYADAPAKKHSLPQSINLNGLVAPSLYYPKTTLCLCFVLILWLSTGIRYLWYDHNLLNMQSMGLESVELEMKLLKKWDRGAWFALSIADSPEELLARKKEFERDSTLKVDEIVSRFPTSSPEKIAFIRQIGASLATIPEQAGTVPIPDSNRMSAAITQFTEQFNRFSDTFESEAVQNKIIRQLYQIRSALAHFSPEEYQRRLSGFQQRLANEVLERLRMIRFASDPNPPEWNDLPSSLVSRYVGQKQGKFLMRIYSTHEIWDMADLKDFITRVKAVDPNATGNPIQTYEASLQMQRSYRQSAILAFFVIVFFIWLDFRSIGYTLMVLIPFGLGGCIALGIMGLLKIPFNPANTIVVPLILGIGVDDGVHLVHNFRRQSGPYQLQPSLVVSVIITTLTTIIGFGSLMIADHRGLQSLGRVLVIGVTSCMFATLIILPALFTLLRKNRSIK